jgi:hypothetical protein
MDDLSERAEKLPQWSETPRAHQFRTCVELLMDAVCPKQYQAHDVGDAVQEGF